MTDPIISTKDRPGEYDAIATAKPGEPLFPIQGGDPFGPPTVLHWAELARKAGLAEQDEKKSQTLLKKASQAEMVAWAMQAYQRDEQEVAGQHARYNDDDERADAETLDRQNERKARILYVQKLNNALAIANDVAEGLAQIRACPMEEVAIREAVEKLKEAAFAIEPRRGNERS